MDLIGAVESFLGSMNSFLDVTKPGRFMDVKEYSGIFRMVVFVSCFVFLIVHFHVFLTHLGFVLNFNLIVIDPYKARWYGRVAFFMGVWGFVLGGVGVLRLYIYRRNHPRNSFCHSKETLMKRFPLLHDLVWGWPFILGLSCIYIGHPVDAVYAIFLGGLAYMVNHALSKASQPGLPVRFGLSLLIGSFTIWCWSRVCIELNGLPPGWQDVPVLPLWK